MELCAVAIKTLTLMNLTSMDGHRVEKVNQIVGINIFIYLFFIYIILFIIIYLSFIYIFIYYLYTYLSFIK